MKRVTIEATAEQVRKGDAHGDAQLQALLNATPAEIDAYIDAHVTNLAEARAMFKSFALALRYLLRRD